MATSGYVQSPGTIASYLMPTIGNVIFVSLLIVLLFSTGNGLLGDGDSAYHIRTGEVILDSWEIPKQDIYSYHPPLEWTAHEWLAEVIMAVVYRGLGLSGIVAFFSLLLAWAHWLMYRTLRERSKDIIACTLITLLATATSSSHWLARPHVFSIILILVWHWLLDRYQTKKDNSLTYLPALMLLWVNLHGGYVIGFVLLGIYLAENLLSSLSEAPAQSETSRRKAKAIIICLLASMAVSLLNPVGYKIWLFPFRVMSDQFIMDRVAEFLSPNFHKTLPFKYMLLTTIGIFALSKAPLNFSQVGLVCLLSYMALFSVRHVSLFAIIVSPILLTSFHSVVNRLPAACWQFYQKRNDNLAAMESDLKGYLWPAATLTLSLWLVVTGSIRFHFNEKVFPVAAVNFLLRERITGNMFNNDEFGDYMIFSAWPTYRVFMDGRSDMYGEKYGGPYLKIANALPGWKEALSQFNVTWTIFDTDSALTAALSDQPDWQPVYSDQIATIFVRKDAEHQPLLNKYPAVGLAKK